MIKSDSSARKTIYLIAAICGFLAVIIFRRNWAAEVSLFNYFGLLPDNIDPANISINNLASIFKASPLMGLILFDFVDLINVGLVLMLLLPIFQLVYQKGNKLILIVAACAVISFLLYCISNNALFFYVNSGSSDIVTKRILLEKLSRKDTSYLLHNIGLFLFYAYGLSCAVIMKKTALFSNYSFMFGILANAIGLSYFALIPVIPGFAHFSIVLAAPFTLIWHTNLSLNLIKMWKSKTPPVKIISAANEY